MSEQKKDLAVAHGGENVLALGQTDFLNLTGLSPTQIAELKRQHVSGLIDVQKKAQEMKVDVAALEATLESFTSQTAKASQAGAHITTTHTQTTSNWSH